MAGLERRRRFVESLAAHPMVEDVDWTRDGYQTAVLQLATTDDDSNSEVEELVECPNCGAVGLEEQIREHDCQDFLLETQGESA